MMFRNRHDAGVLLADRLGKYFADATIVLALPRGGVPVGFEIAMKIGCPLEPFFVRKVGLPSQPELAMGAVVDGREPIIVRNEEVLRLAGISEETFKSACAAELAKIARLRLIHGMDGHVPASIGGRTAILVDDGVATGSTIRAGVQAVKRLEPSRVVVAVPVAPAATAALIRREVDELVCLHVPRHFEATGCYYRDFRQVSDRTVRDLLRQSRNADAIRPRTSPGRN